MLCRKVSPARVGGLYSDANVTACLFSLALFMALYLLKNSTCIWRRLAASLLAGVNAVSLLLTGSRGALLCFAVACLVWLLLERADRVGLLLLLLETAGDHAGSRYSCFLHGQQRR